MFVLDLILICLNLTSKYLVIKITHLINQSWQKNSETTSTNNENQQRADLISTIQRLPENEVSLATSLISNMRDPKGSNKGNIICT
ncbi:2733_t:CDS:2 [Ambispora gerdemannii]|uniref:2733_t:CDS:1 n=1 Tax=Ambispora gerdemannii TaxID=144530 RepID=A0A9N9C1N3_9GLOM|nr:2733_t:CDS:2 [Ambispora gerdemannii]